MNSVEEKSNEFGGRRKAEENKTPEEKAPSLGARTALTDALHLARSNNPTQATGTQLVGFLLCDSVHKNEGRAQAHTERAGPRRPSAARVCFATSTAVWRTERRAGARVRERVCERASERREREKRASERARETKRGGERGESE